MVQTALRLKTRVLPGRRIEITAPELNENTDVELLILQEASPTETSRPFNNVLEFLDSLTPIERTPEEWAQVEREFQEERNSWGD